jgi:hypothetical protein
MKLLCYVMAKSMMKPAIAVFAAIVQSKLQSYFIAVKMFLRQNMI